MRLPAEVRAALLVWPAVALTFSALFAVGGAASLAVDPGRVAGPARRWLATVDPRDTRAAAFNDCLVLAMIVDRQGPWLDQAVSPRRLYRRRRPAMACRGLDQLLRGSLDDEEYLLLRYHHYLHGQRALYAPLVAAAGVRGARRALAWPAAALLALALAAAAGRLLRARRGRHGHRAPPAGGATADPTAAAGLAALAATLLLLHLPDPWWGSFTTAPTDLLLAALVATAAIAGLHRWSARARAALFGSLGAATAGFELFHGAAPLLLAAGLAVLALQPCPGGDRRRLAHQAAAGAAFVACFAGCYALRLAVVAVHFDLDMVRRVLDLLAFRVSGAERTTLAPVLEPLFRERPVSLPAVLTRLAEHADVVGLGSRRLGLALSAAAAAALALAAVTWLRRRPAPGRWAGLLLAATATPLWYLLFPQHAGAHPQMMARLLAWPVAVAAAWWAAWWVGRYRRPSHSP